MGCASEIHCVGCRIAGRGASQFQAQGKGGGRTPGPAGPEDGEQVELQIAESEIHPGDLCLEDVLGPTDSLLGVPGPGGAPRPVRAPRPPRPGQVVEPHEQSPVAGNGGGLPPGRHLHAPDHGSHLASRAGDSALRTRGGRPQRGSWLLCAAKTSPASPGSCPSGSAIGGSPIREVEHVPAASNQPELLSDSLRPKVGGKRQSNADLRGEGHGEARAGRGIGRGVVRYALTLQRGHPAPGLSQPARPTHGSRNGSGPGPFRAP
jgi:hypothetical protein